MAYAFSKSYRLEVTICYMCPIYKWVHFVISLFSQKRRK